MVEVYQNSQFSDEEPYVRYQTPRSHVNTAFQRQAGSTNSALFSQATNQSNPIMQESKGKKSLKRWKIVAVILLVLVAILVAGFGVVVAKIHEPKASQPVEGLLEGSNTSTNHQSIVHGSILSCLHLKELGETKSGYYRIQPDENAIPFETYCDMTTSGGGWTLVASVHENDIVGECTTADAWFNWEREQTNNFISRNWENKFTFGNVRSATSGDYKNSGYYSIQASDVLVRHSPNNEEVENSKKKTFLEYHTENKFLEGYGGNLHSVYSRHYNLTAIPKEKVANIVNNAEMLNALSSSASNIISEIPNFYRYKYDSSSSYRILGSTNDNLFSNYGMQIYVYPCNTIYYGNNHTCGDTDALTSSKKTIPFFALTTIGNKQNSRSFFYYQVRSNRYDGDIVRQYGNTLINGSFTLNYNAYCRYDGTRPSLCDVIYAVSNKEKWKSSDVDFSSPSISSGTNYYYQYQYIRNYPENIVMGYTMLSRTNGLLVSQSQIESALRKILAIISKFQSVAKSTCDNADLNLVQPIKYTVGGVGVLSVPTSLHDEVTPGYMQFRARSAEGIAFAFCPAVRVNTCKSQYLCVGGVGFGSSIQNYCNDYLYWNGGSYLDLLKFHHPGSTSRSQQFIESTIMIFYR